MKFVGKFDKISFSQFKKDWVDSFDKTTWVDKELLDIFENIKLPKRATTGSAGYDFFTPIAIELAPGETIKIPTGIRAEIKNGWFLAIYPRSGLGFKYKAKLANTVGIIDSDYFYSDNEGHIFIKFANESTDNKTIVLEAGDAFAQGIFQTFGLAEDDDTRGVRNGGFGSTGGMNESRTR